MRLIFGVGTGRCGTNSLAKLLSKQPETTVTHEALYVTPEVGGDYDGALEALAKRTAKFVGDVAPWHIWHVPRSVVEQNARFICLKRPRAATVESWVRVNNPHRWHQTEKGWEYGRLNLLPRYDGATLAEALGNYWDHYYRLAEQLAGEFPDGFQIWPTESLNDPAAVEAILRFVGFEEPVVVAGIHERTE